VNKNKAFRDRSPGRRSLLQQYSRSKQISVVLPVLVDLVDLQPTTRGDE